MGHLSILEWEREREKKKWQSIHKWIWKRWKIWCHSPKIVSKLCDDKWWMRGRVMCLVCCQQLADQRVIFMFVFVTEDHLHHQHLSSSWTYEDTRAWGDTRYLLNAWPIHHGHGHSFLWFTGTGEKCMFDSWHKLVDCIRSIAWLRYVNAVTSTYWCWIL